MKWSKVVSTMSALLMVVVSACGDGATAPKRVVAANLPSRYETMEEGGIEWYKVDGVWYPTEETADATIDEPKSMIGVSGKTVYYNADMHGYWDNISETLYWSWESPTRSGSGTAVKTGFTTTFGSNYKRALNTHPVSEVPTCDAELNLQTDHSAWFGKAAKVTITGGGGQVPLTVSVQLDIGVRGRVDATSFALPYSPQICPPPACGPLENLQPTNPFARVQGEKALPSPRASFDCTVGEGGGSGSGSYEGGLCYCQQWFWYEDGVPVDEWWECHDEHGGAVNVCYLT